MLSRNMGETLRATKKDIHKMPRNYNPVEHPMQEAREYIRAMNAAKLERVFAKPFLGAFDGHRDGICSLSKHPTQLRYLFSGSCDGEVRLWDIPSRKCQRTLTGAHEGYVRGITVDPSAHHFFTCGDDKIIKQWSLGDDEDEEEDEANVPVNTIIAKTLFTGIDHHANNDTYATSGEVVDLWSAERNEPLRSYGGIDTTVCVKFNKSETNFLAVCDTARALILYDVRTPQRIRKTIMTMNSNNLAWNPMEPFIFTVANEDFNLYSFDMRNLKVPTSIHKDHVSAVIDIDYSPTGREFVSGSYDKTIRIYHSRAEHSREVYHTKRMQRVSCIRWSQDSRFIFSASEEMIIRVWKASASEKLGVLKPREKEALNYSKALKHKYANHPQVRRIISNRHVPKDIHAATKEHRIIKLSRKKKEQNKRQHSKPGTVAIVPEKVRKVVKEIE